MCIYLSLTLPLDLPTQKIINLFNEYEFIHGKGVRAIVKNPLLPSSTTMDRYVYYEI